MGRRGGWRKRANEIPVSKSKRELRNRAGRDKLKRDKAGASPEQLKADLCLIAIETSRINPSGSLPERHSAS